MVSSLLAAIVRADGDALVMHVGEKPYVVAPAGPVELSSRPLTLEAVAGMLGQLVTREGRGTLDELGAVEHDLPRGASTNGDRFTVVAARGGDDIWIEVRRHRKPIILSTAAARRPALMAAPLVVAEDRSAAPISQPEPAAPPAVMAPPEAVAEAGTAPQVEFEVVAPVSGPAAGAEAEVAAQAEVVPEAEVTAQAEGVPQPVVVQAEVVPQPEVVPEAEAAPAEAVPPPEVASQLEAVAPGETETVADAAVAARPEENLQPEVSAPETLVWFEPVVSAGPVAMPEPVAPVEIASTAVAVVNMQEETVAEEVIPVLAAMQPTAAPERHTISERQAAIIEPIPAVVLPLSRNPVRTDASGRVPTSPRLAGIDRLLRLAAARGANTLYLTSQARPSVRVDGEIAMLDGEPALSAPEVESLLLDLAPERSREALRNGECTEWMSEVPEVGHIRCQSFRDHRGPGGIFRIISARPTSADQLGLSREIQALSAEPEGLILVTGPRSSGKSTLVAALVDLINVTRNDYVISVESQIQFAHEGRGSLISQREVRGDAAEVAAVTRAALRENPDVLVIDDLRSPEVVGLALDAVSAGHLVIAAVAAHTTTAALARLIDQAPRERRAQVQMTLAEGLRGAVAQVLLHKSSGGRVAARELLLNTTSIATLIAEGRLEQLPLALDSGRKHGMAPLNDALAAFVQSGVVDAKEAYRKAHERPAFLAVLRREGLDTSFIERLA